MIEINGYSKSLEILREVFEGDPTVKTIGHGMATDEDLKKATVYPLVYLSPEPTEENQNSNIFRFLVLALAQRVENYGEGEKDHFELDNNMQDNLNSMHAVLNRAVQKLRTEYDDFLNDNWTFSATPVIEHAGNILDGWYCYIDIELKSNIC